MSTFTDVFERKEIKYRLTARQHRELRAALADALTPDEFGCTEIVSTYFDTPERALIDRSLEKPLYKEKLRLRSYGAPDEDDRVFVEIKKKFDGIVYKRRVGLLYAAARAYLGGLPYERACARHPLPDPVMAAESLSPRSRQIAREIDRFLVQHRPLRASMLVTCRRTAYVAAGCGPREGAGTGAGAVGCDAGDLRVTFDADIAYRDLFAPDGAGGRRPLLPAGEAVMEVKSAGPFPLWLVRALDACRAYPCSFSKYGEAYRQCAAAAQIPVGTARAAHAAQATARHAASAEERLAGGARDVRPRRFRAPNHALKKGNRCA